MICTLYMCKILIICKMYMHKIQMICTFYMDKILMICTLYMYKILMICTLYMYKILMICTLYMDKILMICTLYMYKILMICTSKMKTHMKHPTMRNGYMYKSIILVSILTTVCKVTYILYKNTYCSMYIHFIDFMSNIPSSFVNIKNR